MYNYAISNSARKKILYDCDEVYLYRKKDAYAGMPVYNNGLKSAEIM